LIALKTLRKYMHAILGNRSQDWSVFVVVWNLGTFPAKIKTAVDGFSVFILFAYFYDEDLSI